MKSTSSSRGPRSVSAESNRAISRGKAVPNSQSKVEVVDQKTEPEQEENQEPISWDARLKGCIPMFLFSLFVVTYLVCAVIRFLHTDDITMFTTMLPYLAGYVGIPIVTPLVPWGKNKGDDQQD